MWENESFRLGAPRNYQALSFGRHLFARFLHVANRVIATEVACNIGRGKSGLQWARCQVTPGLVEWATARQDGKCHRKHTADACAKAKVGQG